MKMDLISRAKQLKKDIPATFIALNKKETPITAKIIAVIIIGYALSPIDLIPDFIPIIGLLDDIIILPLLITVMIKLIPAEVFEQCRIEAETLWTNGKPKRWYYAIPIVLIWLLIMFVIVKTVWL